MLARGGLWNNQGTFLKTVLSMNNPKGHAKSHRHISTLRSKQLGGTEQYLFFLKEGADAQTCPGTVGVLPIKVRVGDSLSSFISKDSISENPQTSRVLQPRKIP